MFSGKEKPKDDKKSKDSKSKDSGSKDSKHFSGGNHQRESFNKKASESKPDSSGPDKSKPAADGMDTSMDSEEPKTTITHHADGTHTTEHSDGEVSDHPSMDDAAQYMSAKHGGGMDPMSDMSQILGPDGGNGAMEQAGGHGMPMGMGKRSTPSLY